MVTKLTLSQACEGMIYYKQATGKSPSTIAAYCHSFNKLELFFPDDPPIARITRKQLVEFLAWLQNDHISDPGGTIPRKPARLAPKSISNIYVNCGVLWAWAVDEAYVDENIVRTIDRPRFEPPAIETFTRDDVLAMLKACTTTASWRSRPATQTTRPTADRDQAIILLLLDTGVRASELCGISVGDVDLGNNKVRVHGKGAGRGSKQRIVSFGRGCARALWRYITPRLSDDLRDDDSFFVVDQHNFPRPMDRRSLRTLLHRIGERAGISHSVYPHKFRHTFAIQHLRNEGDPFTLQEALGHTDLTMVRRYVRLAQSDLAAAHRRASPVDKWRL